MSQTPPYQRFSGKSGERTFPHPEPAPKDDKPLLFGGMDFAKRVHSSTLEIFELIDSTKLNDSILIERAFRTWDHVKYKQISIDTHRIYPKFPMYQIGFDRSGVGDAAIELFDTVALPMVPILTTNKFKVDMVNSIETLRQSGRIKWARNSPVPQQLDGQLEHKNAATGVLSYPHGSVPNDSLMATGYAVSVAVPFMVHSNEPIIIRRGGDNLNHYAKDDMQRTVDKLLGKNTESKYVSGYTKYLQLYKNY